MGSKKPLDLLYPDLSYAIHGIFIEVSNAYGYLHKERVYHAACAEKLDKANISYEQEPRINIISHETGSVLGTYVPDLVIEGTIVVELKARERMSPKFIDQLEQYLKSSKYELGYLVNFGTPKAQIVRRIYTNDRKPHIRE